MKSFSARRLFLPALAGLICGTVGETLFFLEAQVKRVEQALAEDFRIVLFTTAELPEIQRKIIEDKLRALPGTAEARFVSREASLETLRRQDPELARSVSLFGENPLQSAFEVSLIPEAVGRAGEWSEQASRIVGVGDVRFKPMQVQAVAQCQFYARFLRLAISLASFFWLAGGAVGFWEALQRPGSLGELPSRAALAVIGAAGGMAIIFVAALPLRAAPAAWAAPDLKTQGILFCAGLLGALFALEPSRPLRRHRADDERAALEGSGARL